MKAEFDKEIDALLRRSLRAAGAGAGAPRETAATPHLDADELSAFAENALPAPARLAALSHLSDCDACRGAVVNLSRASGVAVEIERRATVPAGVDPSEAVDPSEVVDPSEARAPGGWFAALFSPRLLRFVAPALALCLVGAVGFVLLRNAQRGADSVAQRAPEPDNTRPGITGGAGGLPAPSGAADANLNLSIGTSANANANVAAPAPEADQRAPAERERPEASAVVESPDGSDGAATGGLARRPASVAATETAAPPPPPAAPSEAAPVAAAPAPVAQPPAARDDAKEKKGEDEAARVEEAPSQQERRANQTGDFDKQQQSPDGSRNRSANNSAYGGVRSLPSSPRRVPERTNRSMDGPRSRGEAGGGGRARADGETREGAETRTAAGHRFRREGNAWVDVNYRPSMPMTGVRRGTEAFRALVADHPELGRVAEQLPGEVITVVRGRAYRIR